MEATYISYRLVLVRSSSHFFIVEIGILMFSSTETVLSEEQMYSIRLGDFWEATSYALTG
jgi:hypothetical protein